MAMQERLQFGISRASCEFDSESSGGLTWLREAIGYGNSVLCTFFPQTSLQQMEKVCFCWSPPIALQFSSSQLVQSSLRVIFGTFSGCLGNFVVKFAMREESSVTFLNSSGKLTWGRRRKSQNFICMPCKSTDLGSIVETKFASLLLSILVAAAGMSVAIPKIRDASNKQ